MNKFYTAQEVADKLKIKKTTVYELIKRGELSSSKIGKQLRVSEDQLSLYLNGAAKNSVSAQHLDYQPESSLLKRDYLLHSRVLPQLSVLSFLYYRKYSIINISKDMREAVKCQVHTVHYV